MAKFSFAQKLKSLFGIHSKEDANFFDDLTDALIEGDIGAKTAVEFVDNLQKKCRDEKISEASKTTAALKDMLLPYVRGVELGVEDKKVNVWMVLGVNGVGKTTSAAKIAKYYADKKINVIMAASDTFRAAAAEQLIMWGERAGVDVISGQEGSDPASVIYDALHAAKARRADILICDTAGRLNNKKNLMNELDKIDRVISRELPGYKRENLIVLDATTGQNALSQAGDFSEVCNITGIVLTKMDGTAKGGIAIAIAGELSVPVKYIGVGEGIDDLLKFDPQAFAEAMFEGDSDECK